MGGASPLLRSLDRSCSWDMAEFGERYSGGEDRLAGPGPRLQQNRADFNLTRLVDVFAPWFCQQIYMEGLL